MRIALVDDMPFDKKLLYEHLCKYEAENELKFDITEFSSGLEFLEQYDGGFDIIFMDIDMPHLNGIEAARRLRQVDPMVVLVFVTNIAQYAICGYEVNAIDYLLKPVSWLTFRSKLEKAVRAVPSHAEDSLIIPCEDSFLRVPVSDIYYLEKEKNYILYHTAQGVFRDRGSMTEMTARLEPSHFSRCTSGCLVNLRYVTRVGKDSIWLGETCLPLARSQRKSFTAEFLSYLGGSGQ